MSNFKSDLVVLPGLGNDSYSLFHPAIGELELGNSTYFQRFDRNRFPLKKQPGYQTSAGLYAAWQLEDHSVNRRIESHLMKMQQKQQQKQPKPQKKE